MLTVYRFLHFSPLTLTFSFDVRLVQSCVELIRCIHWLADSWEYTLHAAVFPTLTIIPALYVGYRTCYRGCFSHYAPDQEIVGSDPYEVNSFSIYLIPSAALWTCVRLSHWEKIVPGIFQGSKARLVHVARNSTSTFELIVHKMRTPSLLTNLDDYTVLQGYIYLIFTCCISVVGFITD
jgi:hypothetical protein